MAQRVMNGRGSLSRVENGRPLWYVSESPVHECMQSFTGVQPHPAYMHIMAVIAWSS